jgi:signal transduction histidine kinase/CheY-like chemotaxis protein
MRIRTLIYYITAGFVLGAITLMIVQYITSANVRELISGNESLLQEYKVSNELVSLQKDLLLFDNKIKSAITTGDSGKIREFELGAAKLRQDARVLEQTADSVTSFVYMNELRELVGRKIDYSRHLVDSFYRQGKPATESLIADHRAIRLSEEITRLTHKIDTSGRIALAQKVKAVDRSGQLVLDWNLNVMVFVLFLLTVVFLIIVGRMKKQAELIGQLNTSERKLKQAALVKENFLANMSHEIRTPLNAILGYTNLLQKKKLDGDAQLHVATVHQSGETLLAIVNDILDLSKIESGMMRIEEAPFSLYKLIHDTVVMFHHRIEEKGLEIKTSLSNTLPDTLIGDSTRLTQILVNLIGNALKFTNEGHIELAVEERKINESQVEIEFRISDTGIGIEEAKLETIFERFRQAEDATTRKYGGTGLGLSIVRDLVYLQNGDIHVGSSPGNGTVVSVIIPYKISETLLIDDHFGADKNLFDFGNQVKVLIVEDNVINQGLMQHMMKEWEVENRIAGTGKEAIEILKQEHFDLIFMDIQMPEMDGYTASTQIRQVLKLTTPIIAMTAHAMAGEKEKCAGFGMDEHLSKPIREADLQRIFITFLQREFFQKRDHEAVTERKEDYQVIDLDYMREISNGDSGYEKLVTEQFIGLVPEQIESLSVAWSDRDLTKIKRTAHAMKTSMSIMGLDKLLAETLDAIENDELSEVELDSGIGVVISVFRDALAEAELFHSRFEI